MKISKGVNNNNNYNNNNNNNNKYLNLVMELKKLCNMEVIAISIVICAFGTVTKGLIQGRKDLEIIRPVKTIHTTALLKSAGIQRRVIETNYGMDWLQKVYDMVPETW